MQINSKLDIILEYLQVIEEQLYVTKRYKYIDRYRKQVFKGNLRLESKFHELCQKYFDAINLEKQACLFMLKHERYLHYNDVIRTLNYMDDKCVEKFSYIDELLNNMEDACEMQQDYKFGLVNKNVDIVEDINNYLNIAKGFTMDRVKDFVLEEEVLNDISYYSAIKDSKILSASIDDIKAFSGVYDGRVIIPKVMDGKTALIAIHELVHKSLLMNKDLILNDNVIYSESLPIFYEHLFESQNKFIDFDIHEDHKADILLETYDDEPMIEQAKKLSYLLK